MKKWFKPREGRSGSVSQKSKNANVALQAVARGFLARRLAKRTREGNFRRITLVQDLVLSEREYLSKLIACQKLYIRPLRMLCGTRDEVIKGTTIATLFSCFDELIGVSQRLVEGFENRCANTPKSQAVNIGDVVLEVPHLLDAFELYIKSFPDSLRLLDELCESKVFQKFQREAIATRLEVVLSAIAAEAGPKASKRNARCSYELAELLHAPVHRTIWYATRLGELHKLCHEESVEGQNLGTVIADIAKLYDIALNNFRKDTGDEDLILIRDKFTEDCPDTIVAPHRRLKRQGNIAKVSKRTHRDGKPITSQRWCYLFNDCIVFTKRLPTSATVATPIAQPHAPIGAGGAGIGLSEVLSSEGSGTGTGSVTSPLAPPISPRSGEATDISAASTRRSRSGSLLSTPGSVNGSAYSTPPGGSSSVSHQQGLSKKKYEFSGLILFSAIARVEVDSVCDTDFTIVYQTSPMPQTETSPTEEATAKATDGDGGNERRFVMRFCNREQRLDWLTDLRRWCLPLLLPPAESADSDSIVPAGYGYEHRLITGTAHSLAMFADGDGLLDLLDRQPDLINMVDTRGCSPLHVAAYCGHEKLLAILLMQSADVGVRELTHWTALHLAALSGSDGAVEKLLSFTFHGCNQVEDVDEYERTPLHLAARQGHAAVCRLLMASGAPINARDIAGWTPLHHAARYGHGDAVQAVLDGGANVDLRTPDGSSAIHLAVCGGEPKAVRALVTNGAPVNVKDANGRTPLHHCGTGAHILKVMCYLVSNGARLDIKDKHGATALEGYPDEVAHSLRVAREHFKRRQSHSKTLVFECDIGHGAVPQRLDKSSWASDEAPTCRLCSVEFDVKIRRHHCRVCGTLTCAKCSTKRVLVSRGDVKTQTSRACDCCFNRGWRRALNAKPPITASSDGDAAQAATGNASVGRSSIPAMTSAALDSTKALGRASSSDLHGAGDSKAWGGFDYLHSKAADESLKFLMSDAPQDGGPAPSIGGSLNDDDVGGHQGKSKGFTAPWKRGKTNTGDGGGQVNTGSSFSSVSGGGAHSAVSQTGELLSQRGGALNSAVDSSAKMKNAADLYIENCREANAKAQKENKLFGFM